MDRWDEVLLNQAEILVIVSTTRHHGTPPSQDMQGALFTLWTMQEACKFGAQCHLPQTPLTRFSRNFLGRFISVTSPRTANSFGGGVGGPFGADREGPPGCCFHPPAQEGPHMCGYHPTFATRSAADLHPMPVRGSESVLWWGPSQLGVAKDARTDGDTVVQWAIGSTLPPARPASVLQLVNDAPPFTNAKKGKRGANVRYANDMLAYERKNRSVCAPCGVHWLVASRLRTSRENRAFFAKF